MKGEAVCSVLERIIISSSGVSYVYCTGCSSEWCGVVAYLCTAISRPHTTIIASDQNAGMVAWDPQAMAFMALLAACVLCFLAPLMYVLVNSMAGAMLAIWS